MKVFSSELELGAAQRGERRDKLIFEHFQTPLSPSNFTALRRRVSQLRQLRFDPQSKYPAHSHRTLFRAQISVLNLETAQTPRGRGRRGRRRRRRRPEMGLLIVHASRRLSVRSRGQTLPAVRQSQCEDEKEGGRTDRKNGQATFPGRGKTLMASHSQSSVLSRQAGGQAARCFDGLLIFRSRHHYLIRSVGASQRRQTGGSRRGRLDSLSDHLSLSCMPPTPTPPRCHSHCTCHSHDDAMRTIGPPE